MEDLIKKLEEARDQIRYGNSRALDTLNEAMQMALKLKAEVEAITENQMMGAQEFLGIPDGKIINFNGTVERINIYLEGQKVLNPPTPKGDSEIMP